MTISTNDPTIILIPGHWLGAWAWDDVVARLTALGRRAVPMTLPGLDALDPERSSRTLGDQVAAIEQVMGEAGASAEQPVVIAAHSGANAPVSLVLDRHPELIGRVVWVDSGPVAPGTVFAPDASDDLVEVPLPPFDVLGEQASLEGLGAHVLERFRASAVPEPGPVLREPVRLTDDARLQVPTTVVCCSISSAQMMELAGAGHPMFAEVAKVHHLDLVDLPTGHWPMWSRPDELAQILADASTSPAG
ncbi:alpha/beta fold hydrolase [Cellulomonas soli]|uniref:Esterase n=1 Tax=Cellulomonas soli TaxID=931535 RepID=A0A512PCV5_9CELL|nr:alpha/beta hydrolase [Cellulomonas soli]NYI58614.1 pimeloyl-ACP methyl ester carboxylesterase [Cellulomonas soli]GEP69039.1 esterase [Cellulomonas soli]